MRRFHCLLLFLALIVLVGIPAAAQSLFISNDEWFTDANFLSTDDDQQLALNVAAWLTANAPGKSILILSDNTSLNNTTFQGVLNSAGYTVTRTKTAPATFLSTSGTPLYDAVFVSGDCHANALVFNTAVCANGFANLNNALISYISAGGNVLLEVGLVCFAGSNTWNPLAHAFGLSIVYGCNGILNSNVNVSAFHTQQPYGPALFNLVNTVYIDNGEDVLDLGTNCGAQVFTDANGNGLYGAWRPCCAPKGNLLVNGSFETGNFNSWTTGGNFQFTEVVTGPFSVYSGAEDPIYYAVLGPVGTDGWISQSFTDTAGAPYRICFVMNSVGDDPSDFTAFWDGTEIFAQTDPNTNGVWTKYEFDLTGTGYDSLTFYFRSEAAVRRRDATRVCSRSHLEKADTRLITPESRRGSSRCKPHAATRGPPSAPAHRS